MFLVAVQRLSTMNETVQQNIKARQSIATGRAWNSQIRF